MKECLTSQVRSNLAPLDKLSQGLGIDFATGYTIRQVEAPAGDMDSTTGQIIINCGASGCAAELEIYPNEGASGIYDVAEDSLRAARFVCLANRKET